MYRTCSPRSDDQRLRTALTLAPRPPARDAVSAWIIEADAAFNIDGKPTASVKECVGLVRMCHEGAAALTEVAELRAALVDALDWLENAPISYANGNVHNGMDEGDVLGGRLHEKLVTQLRAALIVGDSDPVREFPVSEFANNDHQ